MEVQRTIPDALTNRDKATTSQVGTSTLATENRDQLRNFKIEYAPRGIGTSGLECFVCGGYNSSDHIQSDMSAFVRTKEDGAFMAALIEAAGYHAFLDYRPKEPTWIQLKMGACDLHLPNLVLVEYFAEKNSGQLSFGEFEDAAKAIESSPMFEVLNDDAKKDKSVLPPFEFDTAKEKSAARRSLLQRRIKAATDSKNLNEGQLARIFEQLENNTNFVSYEQTRGDEELDAAFRVLETLGIVRFHTHTGKASGCPHHSHFTFSVSGYSLTELGSAAKSLFNQDRLLRREG